MTNSLIHPFFVYDRRKTHGFIYSSTDQLYHSCDRHSIRKHSGRIIDPSEWIDKDLRGIMDFASDTIPISPGKILTPSTGHIRSRNEYDYFTYEISPLITSIRISQYLSQLVPLKQHRELLRSFLHTSLIHNIDNYYIVVRGSSEANTNLMNALLSLQPLIKRARHTVYCETTVNKITLDEIHQARIVLCDINDRTIRPAQPMKLYERPIQYHGIIFQKEILQPARDLLDRTINIISVPTEEIFTGGELLSWILNH